MSESFDDLDPLPEPSARFEDVAARLSECARWDIDLSLAALGDGEPPKHLSTCGACQEIYADRQAVLRQLEVLPVTRARFPKERRYGKLWAAAAVMLVALGLLLPGPKPPAPPPVQAAVRETGPTPLTRFTLAFEDYVLTGDPDAEETVVEFGREFWRPLVRNVGASDARRVEAALVVLKRLRLQETLPALEARLDESGWRNEAIFRTVAALDLPGSSLILRNGLEHPFRRPQALAALRVLPVRRTAPALLALYPTLSEDLRGRADEILLSDADLTRHLLRPCLASFDDATFAAWAPFIGTLKLREAAPRLIQLAHTETHARRSLEGLARLKEGFEIRALIDLPREDVLPLLRAKGKDAVDEIRRLTFDSKVRVAQAAIAMLPEFQNAETLSLLRTLLARPSTHRAAIEALSQIGGGESVGVLLGVYKTSTAKSDIIAALSRIPSDGMLPHLLRMAADPATPLDSITAALEKYPRSDVIPGLLPWLDSPQTRSRAYEILRRLTGETILPNEYAWDRWWQAQNRG